MIVMEPNFVEAYRAAVNTLTDVLTDNEADAREARRAIRSLIDCITLKPQEDGRGVDIDRDGGLHAMMALGPAKHSTNLHV